MSNCHCHTTINRDGSGQLGRYLKALDPGYAPVDGRSMEDLLVFAKRYAAQIRFYDVPDAQVEDDTPPGQVSWKEFFRRDMAVIAASIGTIDMPQIKKDYDENRTKLDAKPSATAFSNLFDPIIGMLVRLDSWYSLAITENPLYADLQLAIQSSLQEQVKKMIAYEEGFKVVDAKNSFTLDFSAIQNDDVWKVNDAVDPDISIYEGNTPEDKIRYAALFVDSIFLSFYGVMSQLVTDSEKYLQFALQQYPAHQPHMALFISFLQLFRLAQEQMNTLTGRVLDFYYREVLQLTEKPSIPDRAFVVFELARDVASFDVAPGTALDAGKDAAGKVQTYKTESGLVVNQAKVKELKTLFIEKLPPEVAQEDKTIQALYARPVANSLDGYGEKFADPYPKWPTFGKGSNHPGEAQNICEALEIINEELHTKNDTAVGFSIASPQLLLQGGNRLITIKLYRLHELFTADNNAAIWLSAEDGWLKIAQERPAADFAKLVQEEVFFAEGWQAAYGVNNDSDEVYIFLPVSEKAVINFDAKLHTGYAYPTIHPVMQVMVGPEVGLDADRFKDLSLYGLSIAVKVGSINKYVSPNVTGAAAFGDYGNFDGLKVLTLFNDDGPLSPDKPFDPFGAYPKVGSAMYIGSPEVFNKSLQELTVNVQPVTSGGNQTPNYKLNLLQDRQWTALSSQYTSNATFPSVGMTFDMLYTGVGGYSGSGMNQIDTNRLPLTYPATWENTKTVKGFLQLVNATTPNTDTKGIFEQSAELAALLKTREISISYTSALYSLEAGIDQFFHVYPFGVAEIDTATPDNWLTDNTAAGVPVKDLAVLRKTVKGAPVKANGSLLPQFTWLSPYSAYNLDDDNTEDTNSGLTTHNAGSKAATKAAGQRYLTKLMLSASGLDASQQYNQYSGRIQEEGMLFIGLEKAQPLQTLSLLFQFAEGTAEDEENDPPQVHWSYLSNNEWRPLRGEAIVFDGTYDFQTTGIIKIDLPEDATNDNTIITGGLHWLCASVTEYANRFPYLVDVVAQVTEAVFEDNGNAPSHFDNALPAGSISKLAVKVAEISKVQQPFASFDGKHQEVGKEFYTRVSERLRHKGRAVNAWDYEHLVLDRFPSIYKVKCIPHTDPNCGCRDHAEMVNGQEQTTCCGPQVAPGHVLVVAIANLKNRNAIDPLRPKTSRRTLLAIEDYLKQRSSPFVQIRARNPVYEQVLTFFRVKFISGTDKGYYLKKLNEELVQFLTPWAFDENAEVKFGQKIYASAIVNFIEERPYVDFITDFLLFVCRDECCPSTSLRGTDAEAAASQDNNDDMPAVLDKLDSCDDVEHFLQEQLNFIGVVVAQPATPRSILVSVPKHIIVPYEEPLRPTRCEQRAAGRVVPGGVDMGREKVTTAELAKEAAEKNTVKASTTKAETATAAATAAKDAKAEAAKTDAGATAAKAETLKPQIAKETATGELVKAVADKLTADKAAADKAAAEKDVTKPSGSRGADLGAKPAKKAATPRKKKDKNNPK
ncbi:hypothetical protein F0L74_24060 [Chitinophaga agrisoli]|uniref:Baseplate J-like protein n=1 Tax=Chitinophaga agrisoli TaxID=2607653 RepID=A0A5B2VKF9_9BACT|nr:hypothetical protein [Chitinophaga agrisoli]KAA2239284.1 hypothetical protein F0L74_24060 [Chitinophaga agrisoli]